MIGRRANRPNCNGAARLTENFSFTPGFNLEFAISDIDRAFCDAACEAVNCWLEVFQKTSSIRNGPKLVAFPAYLGVRKHLGLTLAFREVEGSRNQASHSQSQQQKAAIQLQQAPR